MKRPHKIHPNPKDNHTTNQSNAESRQYFHFPLFLPSMFHLLLHVLFDFRQQFLILADICYPFVEALSGLESEAVFSVFDELWQGGELYGEDWDSCAEHVYDFHWEVEA